MQKNKKEPVAPEPWSGVRDGGKEGAQCIQMSIPFLKLVQHNSEDCLFLNVYSSQLPEDVTDPKAVMVWIHGGAFITGSGGAAMYGPDYLLDGDVIVVTLNYRLGMLGFFGTDDGEIRGNMGLMDQVAALKWVKDNIAHFGGDPERVTVFGESAGSVSTYLLMLSPMCKGLFQRVICQSGTPFSPWSFKTSVQENADIMANAVGCGDVDKEELLACLRRASADKCGSIGFDHATPEDTWRLQQLPVMTTVDGKFIQRNPRDMLADGDFNKVDMMIGVNSGEGLIMMNPMTSPMKELDKINAEFERFVPRDLNLTQGSDAAKSAAEKIRDFYFDGAPISEHNMDKYRDLSTDRLFLLGTKQAIDLQSKTSDKPTYLYELTYEGLLGYMKPLIGNMKYKGVCHADDLGYIFHTKIIPIPTTLQRFSPGMTVLKRMVKMWTNFAKTGNPTPEQTALLPVKWERYTPDNPFYMNIGKQLNLEKDIAKDRMAFWDELYAQYSTA